MPPNLRIGLVQTTPNQPFYPGSTITGSLLLDVDEPKSYNQILIHFSGRSYVHWTETHTVSGTNHMGHGIGVTAGGHRHRHHHHHSRTETRHYTSSEAYVDVASPLWSKQQSPDGKLAPGQYSWPFSFNIPPTAPSSFEGSVGHIRYSLVGKIVTGLFKFDHNVELRVPIQQLVKISDPRLLQPVRQEVQKTVCCLCCASGPIVLTVALPKTGLLIGESLQLHASLENGSNRRLTMLADIAQHIVYRAQGHRRDGGRMVLSIRSNEIEPQASQNWDPTIQIPSEVEVIHETSCTNIAISYSLSVICQIPRALNLTVVVPLKIGNCREEPQIARVPPTAAPPYQMTGAYPPPPQSGAPNQLPPQAAYPPPTAPYAPPPANVGYTGATVGPPPPPQQAAAGSNIGWPSNFPPPQPQETFTDFSAHQIEKGIK